MRSMAWATRVQALSRLYASHIAPVPQRRRRTRLDLDLTDPADYQRTRAPLPSEARLLIVDRNFALHDHVTELLGRHPVPVDWLSDARVAVDHCQRRRISLVLINTATLELDPYQLCKSIKQSRADQHRTVVIFLATQSFIYNVLEGQRVECDGFLNQPLTDHVLLAVLQKFLRLTD
jgi:CheY-like chemotaxis protein